MITNLIENIDVTGYTGASMDPTLIPNPAYNPNHALYKYTWVDAKCNSKSNTLITTTDVKLSSKVSSCWLMSASNV